MANWLARLLLGAGGDKEKKHRGPIPVDGYQTTASGLQYCDLEVGAGAAPKLGQKVQVHYTGWLTNGRYFDSSVKRNKPFTFELGRRKVIKGWDEGVASMQVGGVRQLKIPPALGYGAVGSPPVLPDNAPLIFEVELLALL